MDHLTSFVFHFLLPYTIALSSFIFLMKFIEDRYQKANEDGAVKKILKISLCVALGAFLIVGFKSIAQTKFGMMIGAFFHKIGIILMQTSAIGSITAMFINFKNHVLAICAKYWLDYFNAFLLVYFFGALIALAGLHWRINFYRALNVILEVIFKFPMLIFRYFSGYQTPIKDAILQGVLQSKIRENLNDSYESAVAGYDDRGKKFQDGAGGTASTQTKKATAVAIRRAKVSVKTAAYQRKVHILVRQSRETETDRSIESALKGLGERLNADSVLFPADPTYSSEEKGYTFDSNVHYDPSDELGSFKDVFINPFEQHNSISLGGRGIFSVFKGILVDFCRYLRHLTPISINERMLDMANNKFFIDQSMNKAKYHVQQNLDLSLIPIPKDSKTGNTIDEQRTLALQIAEARTPDVTAALNGFGLSGKFIDVKVGGNTAVYRYSLPPDPKLPNDFDKVQEQIGNLLHINDKPIITLSAGILSISMNNGVNIPVSFTDMINKRSKGASCIISGMLGMDAMNKPIYFELGDKNPHAILFGKTGTGKTVTIFTILYSIMSATDPQHLRIAFCDGKGNSFEFMKLDGEHPNPFVYAPPADASGDIEYARALISHMEDECRRRIGLFKEAAVAKLSEYNEKYPDKALPEILFVCDEFSAITQKDNELKAMEVVKKGTVDKFEYLAKMARSTGIRMLMANQSARKELVPGKIAANITGRVSLGVTEPIEAEIALPETGIKINLIDQPGEFYSIMNGPRNPEHGNSPYIPQKVADKLNDALTEKFGKAQYVKTRDEIMEEFENKVNKDKKSDDNIKRSRSAGFGSSLTSRESSSIRRNNSTNMDKSIRNQSESSKAITGYKVIEPPEKLTKETPLEQINKYAMDSNGKYIPYLLEHMEIINNNDELKNIDPDKRKQALTKQTTINAEIDKFKKMQERARRAKTRRHVTGTQAKRITNGKDGEIL